MKTLREQEVRQMFSESVLPGVIEYYGEGDKSAISEAWSNFLDHLFVAGVITTDQVSYYIMGK